MTDFEFFMIAFKFLVLSIGAVNFTMLITLIVLFIVHRHKKEEVHLYE